MRIGIASFAHVHAAGYAALLRDWPDVEVIAADPDGGGDPTRGRSAANALGMSYVDTYDELFDADLDGVVVCTENSRHRAVVERAACAGVPVLCEKPIATTMADGEAMVSACGRAGVALMIAYPVRFSPLFGQLKDAVAAGQLGTIVAATATNNGKIPINQRSWFADPELAGGGSLMDHTVHAADLLGQIMPAPPVSVYAQTNRIMHAQDAAAETGGIVVINYADGAAATIDCSWSRPASYPTWGGLTLELTGDGATAAIDVFGAAVTGYGVDRPLWLPFGADLDRAMMAEFLGAIEESRLPQPDGDVGLDTLAIVTAGYESARTGVPVAL